MQTNRTGQQSIGKYIYAIKVPVSEMRKTSVYHIKSKQGDDYLGAVQWFGRWRCYAFYPQYESVYEQVCLRNIADFCETLTKQHRRQQHDF